jgi:predicted DNA-binding transcriptional regulator YafY
LKLFHEVYNRYVLLLYEMLRKSQSSDGLTWDDIRRLVSGKGFFYENIQFEEAVTGRTKSGGPAGETMGNAGLLVLENGYYVTPFGKAAERITPTLLERRWLKTILTDPRARLFLSESLLEELDRWLEPVEPLFDFTHVMFRNYRVNGDPYHDPAYARKFRTILRAVQERQWLELVNITPAGKKYVSRLIPYRLEYSIKDDVFRICGGVDEPDGGMKIVSIRLSRIRQAVLLDIGAAREKDERLLKMLQAKRAPEKAVLEIHNDRNGFERFLHFFSNYSRIARYDEVSGKLMVELEYYDFDESELLISILAMGPILKVMGPERLRSKVIERLRKQNEAWVF